MLNDMFGAYSPLTIVRSLRFLEKIRHPVLDWLTQFQRQNCLFWLLGRVAESGSLQLSLYVSALNGLVPLLRTRPNQYLSSILKALRPVAYRVG